MEETRYNPKLGDYGEGAWIKYILQFNMPTVEDADKVRKDLINMLRPIMDVAPKGNYELHDIRFALWAYDDYWSSYFIYKRRGRYNPDLIELKRGLRLCFKMELTRGKKMMQMGMIFQPKQNIIQRLITHGRDKTGFFKSKPKEPTNDEIMQEQ